MRILIVSNGIIDNDNGVGRVHYEIMHEYQKAGHYVGKVDYTDLYPNGQNHFDRIFGKPITKKIFNYLKKNASKYEVIEANFDCVIYPKEKFGFKGLLLVRSHGIRPLEADAEKVKNVVKAIKRAKAQKTLKAYIGSFLRYFHKKLTIEDFYLSLKYADLIHSLNETEYDFFIGCGVSKERLVLIPNGLPNSILINLELIQNLRKDNPRVVSFIAGWRLMKGIKDWREISKLLIQIRDFKQILLLGTSWPENIVKKDFDSQVLPFLKIVKDFKPCKLPNLLKNVKVGIFTSYTEGFGFAVLEQLASGIPVVAYNISGVSDFLNQVDSSLLIEPGNITELVDKVRWIFELENKAYEKLSNKCVEVSKKYVLENIAPLFLGTYEGFLRI